MGDLFVQESAIASEEQIEEYSNCRSRKKMNMKEDARQGNRKRKSYLFS